MSFFSRLLILGLISVLSSCGFQLRGDLYAELDKVLVNSAPSAVKSEKLLNEILANSEKRASEDNSEFLIINLLSEKSSRRPVLKTASMSAAQYELTIELIFFISFGDRIIVPETTLSSRKLFAVSSSNQAASYEEQLLLQREMREELLARLISMAQYNLARIRNST